MLTPLVSKITKKRMQWEIKKKAKYDKDHADWLKQFYAEPKQKEQRKLQ
jgi:hypothetical protein